MALYVYKCTQCGELTEKIRLCDDRDLPVECQHCGFADTKRTLAKGFSWGWTLRSAAGMGFIEETGAQGVRRILPNVPQGRKKVKDVPSTPG